MIDSAILSELSSLGLTGEQYQAVLSILSRIESRAETSRTKGRERTSRWRHRDTSQPPLEEKSNPLPSVAKATAQSMNDFVWLECPKRLESLGLSERAARSNLGRWLKQTKSPERVLEAVEAAERAGTRDPVPYITQALKPKVLQFGTDWELGAARQIEERKKEKPITDEERQANLAKLATLKFGAKKL